MIYEPDISPSEPLNEGEFEIEFSCSHLTYRKIQLRRDGLFGVAESIFPQSAGLNHCEFDEMEVDKVPGEDGLLKVTTQEGWLEATYHEEKWRVRTDMAGLRELAQQQAEPEGLAAGNASSLTERAPVPLPMPQPTLSGPGLSLFGVIAIAAVILVVLVLGYITFEEPIGRVMEASAARRETRAKETEIRLIETKAKDAYRALQSHVQTTSDGASQKVARLDSASQRLAEIIRQSTGVSLSDIARNSDLTPREIDQLIRKDENFLRAWNDLLNAFTSEVQLSEYRRQIHQTSARSNDAVLRDVDRTEIDRLNAELDARLRAIENVSTSVGTVQESLASKRLVEKMSKEARTTP